MSNDPLEMTISLAQMLHSAPPAVCPHTGNIHLEGPGWRLELHPSALPQGHTAAEMLACLYVYLHTRLNPAIRAHCAARALAPDMDAEGVYTLSVSGYPLLSSTSYTAIAAVFNQLIGRDLNANTPTYAEYLAWLELQFPAGKLAGRYARVDQQGWVCLGPEVIPAPVTTT